MHICIIWPQWVKWKPTLVEYSIPVVPERLFMMLRIEMNPPHSTGNHNVCFLWDTLCTHGPVLSSMSDEMFCVMITSWKQCLHYWPFMGESTDAWWIRFTKGQSPVIGRFPSQKASNTELMYCWTNSQVVGYFMHLDTHLLSQQWHQST